MEMDSTTVILPKHTGTVDKYGNILIYPDNYKPLEEGAAAPRKARKQEVRQEVIANNAASTDTQDHSRNIQCPQQLSSATRSA
jgi:hypothetical protein